MTETPGWGTPAPEPTAPKTKPWIARHKILTAVGALVAVSALGSLGGGEEPKAEPAAAEAVATEAAPSKAPAKPKATKNPLASSANKTACAKSRREVADEQEVFAGVAKGTELPAAAGKAAARLQDEMRKTASYAEGAIRVEMADLSDTYGRMKVTLATGDTDGLMKAVEDQNTGLGALGKLCDSIGA